MSVDVNARQDHFYKLYLIDNEELFFEAMVPQLQSRGYQPNVFSSADELLRQISPEDVGCVVGDLGMQPMEGIGIQSKLNASSSDLSFIVLIGSSDVPATVKLMRAGVFSVMDKPLEPDELIVVIDAATRASVEIARQRHEVRSAQERVERLSPEEMAVLDCAAQGKANKVIGEELSLSNRTVDRRRQSALKKLDAESVAEFAALRERAKDRGNLL